MVAWPHAREAMSSSLCESFTPVEERILFTAHSCLHVGKDANIPIPSFAIFVHRDWYFSRLLRRYRGLIRGLTVFGDSY